MGDLQEPRILIYSIASATQKKFSNKLANRGFPGVHKNYANPELGLKRSSVYIIWNPDIAGNHVHWIFIAYTIFIRTP